MLRGVYGWWVFACDFGLDLSVRRADFGCFVIIRFDCSINGLFGGWFNCLLVSLWMEWL